MPFAIAALVLAGALLVSGWQNRPLLDVLLARDGTIPGGSPNDFAAQVINADPGAAAGIGAIGPLSPTMPGSDHLAALIQECNRIAALDLRYVFGGGHLGYPPNGPFDCSGACSYVLHKVGLLTGPPRVSTAFMAYGSAGPGKNLTIWANTAHMFLEINGTMWGTVGGTLGQPPNHGPKWHHRSTAGFVARHPAGY